MSKYSRLGKNTLLVFVGNIGSKLISLLMLPFYTKWLSVDDYGTTDLIFVYVSFLLCIITCCVAEAIFIFPKDQQKEKQSMYFSSGLFFSLLVFSIACLFFYISNYILSTNNIYNIFTEYTWVIFGLIVATFFQNYLQQFSRSINKIKEYALSGLVLAISTALFSFFLIPELGFYGYVYSQFLALIISSIYTFFAISGYKYFIISNSLIPSAKEMLKYSMPLIPNGIMWWVVSALNRPIMEEYLGIHSIGIYAVANKLPSVMIMLFTVFTYSWQISVIEEFKKDGYKYFYNKVLRGLFFILVLISCLITIFSKFIVGIVADVKFIEAWKYVPILCIAVLFSSLSGFVGVNFSAARESKYYFYSSVWGAVASLIFNFLLIPNFGLWGVSLAVVLSYVVMAISRVFYSWKYVQIKNWAIYVFMLFLNFIFILITFYDLSYCVKCALYLLLFLCLFYANRSFFGEVKLFIKKNRKR